MNTQAVQATDSYKLSHDKFADDKTQQIYSNFTPRSSKYMPVIKEFYDDKAVVFWIQGFIKDFLIEEFNKTFFHVPKEKAISKFKRRITNYLGPDAVNYKKFEDLHDLGYLPIRIKALPEGARVSLKVPFFTITNTDYRFDWLPNYLETIISCEMWKPIVVATIAYELRKMVNKFAEETVGSTLGTEFQLHGFEFRGMSGRQDAAKCAAAFLLSSCGTDTIPGIDALEDYYNADSDKEFIAASVPASEHSVTSLGTSLQGELDFFREAITQKYPTGIVSLVSDTYDFFKVVTEFARELKDDILNRQPNALGLAKVVFRPDSGNPVNIVCGYKWIEVNSDADIERALYDNFEAVKYNGEFYKTEKVCLGRKLSEAEIKGAVECLWDVFGGSVSDKGYRVLHERTGLVYGDSVTQDIAYKILSRLKEKGFASNNIVFGVGSFTLNMLSRDCLGLAIKATWAQVDGVGYDLYKDPITDDGTKKSAKGLLQVKLDENGEYVLRDQVSWEEEEDSELKTVFENGKIVRETSLAEIRARLWDKQ